MIKGISKLSLVISLILWIAIVVLTGILGAGLDIFLFIIFNIFCVIAPAAFILRIFNIFQDKLMTKIVVSYSLGYSILVILRLFNSNILLFFMFFLGLIEFILLFKTNLNYNDLNINKSESLALLIIIDFLVVISFLGMVLANPSLNIVDKVTYNQDFIWHIGNVNSLSQHIPPVDPRVSGVTFKYHYFYEAFLSVFKRLFHAESYKLILYISPLFNIFMLAVSAYVFSTEIASVTKKRILFLISFFFFGCASLTSSYKNGYGLFLNIFFYHIITNVNIVATSLILLITAIILLIEFEKSNYKNFYILILIFIIMFSLTGTKGPFALLLCGSIIVSLLILLINRKMKLRNVIIVSLFVIIPFAAIYYRLLNNSSDALMLNLGGTITGSNFFVNILSSISRHFGIGTKYIWLLQALLIPLHFFLLLPFQSIFYTLALFKNLRSIHELKFSELIINGIAISGLLFTYLFMHSGNSQLYFFIAAYPFITWISVNYFIDLYEIATLKISRNALSLCSGILIAVALISSISSYSYHIDKGKEGLAAIIRHYDIDNGLNTLSKGEYEGLLFLRDNSTPNEYFASNRQLIAEDSPRYFYFSAFSERQAFLEGYDYIYSDDNVDSIIEQKKAIATEIFYKNNFNSDLLLQLYNDQVRYLCFSKLVPGYKDFNLPSNLVNVFENPDIIILKINIK